MNKFRKIFILLLGVMASVQMLAQDKIVNPDISYAGTPRTLTIGGINVCSRVSPDSRWVMK